jgi:hypothetical protein
MAAFAVLFLVAACKSGAATPVPTAAPTPTAATATATDAPAPGSTATAVATPTSTPERVTTGVPGAVAYVRAYEDALIAGQFPVAWAMLAPAAQLPLVSLSAYTTQRTAYLLTAGKAYTVEANPPSTMSLSDYLQGASYAAAIDMTNAVLVRVDWTALSGNDAGWEMWIVNPTAGGWELYEAH